MTRLKDIEQLIVNRHPSRRLSYTNILVSASFLQQVAGSSYEINWNRFRSHLPNLVISPSRVSAANALLDRAYGKPAVKEEKEIVDLPPVVIQLTNDH